MNMINTTYNTTDDMINKLKQLKGKTKLKFFKSIGNYYDEMSIRNYEFEEYPFSKYAQGIYNFYHEVSVFIKILQTKPQFKNTNIIYYDLYYNAIKNRDDKKL